MTGVGQGYQKEGTKAPDTRHLLRPSLPLGEERVCPFDRCAPQAQQPWMSELEAAGVGWIRVAPIQPLSLPLFRDQPRRFKELSHKRQDE